MAVLGNVQIQELPDAAVITAGAELLHLKQGTNDRKATIAAAINFHTVREDNPHNVSKAQVGLSNVDNDKQLKVSENLADVADKATSRDNLEVYSKTSSDANLKVHTDKTNNPHNVTKAQVGLGSVPNLPSSDDFREDADKLATSRALSALFRAIQNESPIGTVLHTFDSRNPKEYKLCGGDWELIGKGRTLVGYDSADPTRAVDSTFGSKTVSIGVANLPAHAHGVNLATRGHTHQVTGQVGLAGAHSHVLAGSTTAFDHGMKGGSTSSGGQHSHTGATNVNGDHKHAYAADDQLPTPWGVWSNNVGSYDAESSGNGRAKGPWTGNSGAHSHTFTTNTGGEHTHTVSIQIGSHTHNLTGSTANQPDHSHQIDVESQTATDMVIGNTANTGSGSALSIEQPSLVCYIWRRTA